MYQFQYADTLEENLQDARARERQALDRAIELLETGQEKGGRSREALEGLSYVQKLWAILIGDLANPENDLPEVLKADLISIGLWITREANLIRIQKSENFAGLIDICSIVRDGLK